MERFGLVRVCVAVTICNGVKELTDMKEIEERKKTEVNLNIYSTSATTANMVHV